MYKIHVFIILILIQNDIMESIVRCCTKLYICIGQLFKSEKEEEKPLIDERERRQIELPQIKNSKIQTTQDVKTPEKVEVTLVNSVIKEGKQQKTMKKQQSVERINSQDDSSSMVSMVSNPSILRRTFKSISQKKKHSMSASKAKNQSPSIEAYKSIKNFDDQFPQPIMVSADSKVDKYSQYFAEWNKKQYQLSNKKCNHVMSQGEQIKLKNQSLLYEAVNQLQDYYTFYLNERRKENQVNGLFGYYHNKGLSLMCSYRLQDQNILTNSYMKLISFTCNTENPTLFLQWYNSVITQGALNNFYNINLLENGQFPIFQVEQFGTDIVGKNVYTLVRQIQMVKFDHEAEKQYILQLDMTMGKGKKFKSLLKFDIRQVGNVEIYWECNEDIKVNNSDYFGKMWKKIEEKLIKDKILELYKSNKYQK